jgi:TorA maturation chaperone TorD
MGFLARKEAYAIEFDDEARKEETVSAQRLFLRDHLARFAPAFGRALEREDGEGFYAGLGALFLALVTHECDRLNVRMGTPAQRLPQIRSENRLAEPRPRAT